VQPLFLAGEGQHAHAQKGLLQVAVEAGLGQQRRVGIVEMPEQMLLTVATSLTDSAICRVNS